MSNHIFNAASLLGDLESYTVIDEHDSVLKESTLEFVKSTPEFYKRSHLPGHVTGSAWIIDRRKRLVLLTHHAKLNRWMQLGGHVEDDADIQSAALREAREESGLNRVEFVSRKIFDIDIHEIPKTPKAPAHLHYDIRFLLDADSTEPFRISSESNSLVWSSLENVHLFTNELSVLRMIEKTTIQTASLS